MADDRSHDFYIFLHVYFSLILLPYEVEISFVYRYFFIGIGNSFQENKLFGSFWALFNYVGCPVQNDLHHCHGKEW